MKTLGITPQDGCNGFATRPHGNGTPLVELDNQIDTERLLSPPRSFFGKRHSESHRPKLKIVILSSAHAGPNNHGHVSIHAGLMRELSARGHNVLLLERDADGNVSEHDLPKPAGGRVGFYSSAQGLKDRFAAEVREADLVIVEAQIPEGTLIGDWVGHTAQGATAFYDLDLPFTMANLVAGNVEFISEALIRRFDLYLSSTGGVMLDYFAKHYCSPMARPLYASVDATLYFPERQEMKWDLGYIGAYDAHCQPALERLLVDPARRCKDGRFVIAGSQYPRSVHLPRNVKRLSHLAVAKQRAFYNAQRFTLNLTSSGVIAAGFSPSASLFEAAACGTPVMTEFWPGLDTFFKPDEEILISHSTDETMIYLEEISELERRRMGYRARECVLSKHTVRHRAFELENYALEVLKLSGAAI